MLAGIPGKDGGADASGRPRRVGMEPPPSSAIAMIALVVTLITDIPTIN